MKQLTIILLLILSSCKSETKSESNAENENDKSPKQMWGEYLKSNPNDAYEEIPDADFFHTNKEDANRLGELVVNGKKKASSSLFSLYEKYNVEVPKVGKKQIVTNFEGKALAIIATIKVDTIPFNQITAAYAALDMGTNTEPLKKWKKAHWDFFESFLKESEETPSEDMLILCESIEIIWPKNE
jgi:uncharacterized protein YhfF